MWCFRKPWLRVKSVNFDFSAKLSSNIYNESDKPNSKSLAPVGFKKSLVELEFQKISFFTFFIFFSLLKSSFFHTNPWFPKTYHKYRQKCIESASVQIPAVRSYFPFSKVKQYRIWILTTFYLVFSFLK